MYGCACNYVHISSSPRLAQGSKCSVPRSLSRRHEEAWVAELPTWAKPRAKDTWVKASIKATSAAASTTPGQVHLLALARWNQFCNASLYMRSYSHRLLAWQCGGAHCIWAVHAAQLLHKAVNAALALTVFSSSTHNFFAVSLAALGLYFMQVNTCLPFTAHLMLWQCSSCTVKNLVCTAVKILCAANAPSRSIDGL